MKILFVRHAIAMKSEEYGGNDLGRPLTKKGASRAKKVFQGLSALYPVVDRIVCSRAVRAVQTAELLRSAFKKKPAIEITELLNPGADYHEFIRFLHGVQSAFTDVSERTVAVVGHEPDFSDIISGLLLYNGEHGPDDFHSLPMQIKKASVVEMEQNENGAWELVALIPPRVMRRL